jgi:hypothetical protein
MYKQLINPNTNITWVNEMCLMDVREAFGVTNVGYPTAIANWNASTEFNHPNQTPPSNVAVPIYFSIPSIPAGHVCLWDNGTIYTSSAKGKQVFTNIQALINWMGEGFVYLGWSEMIEKTSVVKFVPAPAPSSGTLHLSKDNTLFHLYKPGGPYNPKVTSDILGIINPAEYGGLSYPIIADLGNNIFRIKSQMYGIGDLWCTGSNFTVS